MNNLHIWAFLSDNRCKVLGLQEESLTVKLFMKVKTINTKPRNLNWLQRRQQGNLRKHFNHTKVETIMEIFRAPVEIPKEKLSSGGKWNAINKIKWKKFAQILKAFKFGNVETLRSLNHTKKMLASKKFLFLNQSVIYKLMLYLKSSWHQQHI